MNIELKDLLEIAKEISKETTVETKKHPYKVGKKYFVRTVTMSHLGILKEVYDNELVFEQCSWIADTGRFSDFLNGEYTDSLEVEPFPNEVIVGRGALIDCTPFDNELLRSQK